MDFRVLGGLEVTGEGQTGPLPGVKERAILARLLVDPGRHVSADALIEAAWGEVPRESAARSLSVRIANLRGYLEPDRPRGAPPLLLQRDRAGYRLAIEPEQVDAQRFEQGVRHAATLPAAAALDAYDAALELWRGTPFADLSYAAFAQAEIERLEELRREALEGRARALIALGRPGDAAPELRQMAAQHPLREELIRTLMLALYASGRQVDALAAYRDLAERLSEVGLQPATETRELERRILVQDPVLRAATEAPPPEPEPDPEPEEPLLAADSGVVDRETELTVLRQALARALSGRRGVVAICGEPGVGKSTLVEAFMEESSRREGILVGFGQCVEHRGPGEPYLPVLEAIASLADGPDQERIVAELARRAPTWLAELPWLLDADELEGLRRRILGATRDRMLREMIEALEAMSNERPLAIVLEDLHWADPSTLDLIGAIARRRRPARLLIAVTYQPADSGAAGAQKLARDLAVRGLGVEIPVDRLDAGGVAAYLADRFPGSEAAERLAPLLTRRSGGNPLFMRQLVDHWEQHGVVSPGGALTFPPEELTASVPASLRAYIDEQLAAQAPEDVELLVAASVAGRSFSPALIADAVGRRDSEVRAALTRMAGTGGGMIEPLGDGFRFAHDLYREVLYESAPEDERAALHRRIATFMEHSLGPSVRDLAGELAHHFVAGGDAAGAARFLRMAGERAFARNAYPEGVRHVRAALAAAAKLPDGTSRTRAQVELLSLLGQALVAIGGWGSPEAEEALQRARTLAQRLRDNEPLVSVLLALATLYEVRGELGRAKEVADQYLTHGADEPAARRLQAEELLACNLFHQGAFARALEHAEQGLELFGDDDGGGTEGHYSTFPATIGDNAGVACHDWAGLALWYLGHPDQALTRAREALELAGDPGRSYSLASARAQLAVIHQCRQEPRQALEWAEATIDAAEERGYAYRVAMGRVLRGWAVAALGDAEAGVEELVRGIRASRATGARMDEPHYLGLLGDAYLRADEVEAAAHTIDEALEISFRERSLYYDPELLRLRSAVIMRARHEGAAAEGEASLREAVEVARDQGSRSLELRSVTALVRLARQQGRGGEARAALATVFESFDEGFDSHDLRVAAELLGRDATPV